MPGTLNQIMGLIADDNYLSLCVAGSKTPGHLCNFRHLETNKSGSLCTEEAHVHRNVPKYNTQCCIIDLYTSAGTHVCVPYQPIHCNLMIEMNLFGNKYGNKTTLLSSSSFGPGGVSSVRQEECRPPQIYCPVQRWPLAPHTPSLRVYHKIIR